MAYVRLILVNNQGRHRNLGTASSLARAKSIAQIIAMKENRSVEVWYRTRENGDVKSIYSARPDGRWERVL